MRRSRRVYQSPDTSSAPLSDADDEKRHTKKNANNDPTQPLTGQHQDSAANGSLHPDGDKRQEAGSFNDEASDDSSSIFTRCLCCWRQAATDSVRGENSM